MSDETTALAIFETMRPADPPLNTRQAQSEQPAAPPVDIATAFDKPKDETPRGYNASETDETTHEDRAAVPFGDALHNETHLVPLDTEGAASSPSSSRTKVFCCAALNEVSVANAKSSVQTWAAILQEAVGMSCCPTSSGPRRKTQTAGDLVGKYGADGDQERISRLEVTWRMREKPVVLAN